MLLFGQWRPQIDRKLRREREDDMQQRMDRGLNPNPGHRGKDSAFVHRMQTPVDELPEHLEIFKYWYRSSCSHFTYRCRYGDDTWPNWVKKVTATCSRMTSTWWMFSCYSSNLLYWNTEQKVKRICNFKYWLKEMFAIFLCCLRTT